MTDPTPWWAADNPTDAGGSQEPAGPRERRSERSFNARDITDFLSHAGGPGVGSAHADDAHADGQTCGWCPVCAFARAAQEHGPDVAEHVASAIRELTAAVRLVVDSKAPAAADAEASSGIERIVLDDDAAGEDDIADSSAPADAAR